MDDLHQLTLRDTDRIRQFLVQHPDECWDPHRLVKRYIGPWARSFGIRDLPTMLANAARIHHGHNGIGPQQSLLPPSE